MDRRGRARWHDIDAKVAGRPTCPPFVDFGNYGCAVVLAAVTGGPADIAAVRQYQNRGGVSMNIEQEITSDLGAFVRAGWADGNIEPYAFTDIDRTVAAGISLSGKPWGRPNDTVGFAGVVNGISPEHAAFLNDGGLGIVVGDGQLPIRARRNRRGLLQLRSHRINASLCRLSARRQSGLRYRTRASECLCRAVSLAILACRLCPASKRSQFMKRSVS